MTASVEEKQSTVINIPGYKIVRTLGKGGMATVYLAIQESFEREVALKVMSPNLSEDPKFSERFLREAKIVSRLVHPNIVTVYDVGLQNGHHFLSMEYVPGKDLKSKRRFMTAKQCIRMIKEVAAALDYASKKGYVHRDVKPENIMLHEEDGRAVLMDFGIACMEDTASGMTQTGTAIGTPHYMSPEQAKGRQVDSRSDIYSLGVVFFLCLTGHVPYDADSAVAVGIKHVSEAIPKLPKYLILLQPIIDKVLAKDPGERYQTGQELIAAIDQITDEDLKAIDILATKKTIARIDTKDTEAPTVISGSVKTIPKVEGQTPANSMSAVNTRAGSKAGAARQTPAKTATQTTGARRKAAVTARTQTGNGKRHTTATTSPIRATTGSGGATTTGTQSLAATEVLSVDEDDRRDRARGSGNTSRLWPWFLVVGVIGLMAGGYYFKSSLPPQLQQVVTRVEQQVQSWLGNASSGSPEAGADDTAATAEPETASPTTAGTDDGSDTPVASPTGDVAGADTLGQQVADGSVQPSTAEATLGAARSLSERLEEDLGVAPELAQMYRDALAANPDNRNAELGLMNLKQFHFSHVRDALRDRDVETADRFLQSLQASFADINSDETYQRLVQRSQDAAQAAELIARADELFATDNLTTPAGGNALETYKAALEVDPGNPIAAEGVSKIVERYASMARESLEAGDYQQTQQYTNSGLAVDADNADLQQLKQQAMQRQELENNIAEVLLNAKRAVADERYVAPAGDNAYEYYQQLRTLGRPNEASTGISDVENLIARQIERDINSNNFDAAKQLLLQAKNKYTTSDRLLGLEVGLEQAIQADFEARQPKITTVVVSNQPIQSVTQPQQNPLRLERTVHIGFEFKNFVGDTSVVQAVLYDGARSIEIAQQPVIVSGAESVKYFQIDRPVEGFAAGGYNIDLLLDGETLASLNFQVDRSAAAAQ